jgi:hypothetical protein
MDYSALGAIRGSLNFEKGISASLATRDSGDSQEPLVVAIGFGKALGLF